MLNQLVQINESKYSSMGIVIECNYKNDEFVIRIWTSLFENYQFVTLSSKQITPV